MAVALGVGFAVLIVASGIAATAFQFHDDSEIQREVFGNIPSAWKLVFYTALPILVLYGGFLFSQRVKNWERGAPDHRSTTTKNVGRRLEGLPGRCLHADAAARSRRGDHAQPHLLLASSSCWR